jgi:hypothetical protein
MESARDASRTHLDGLQNGHERLELLHSGLFSFSFTSSVRHARSSELSLCQQRGAHHVGHAGDHGLPAVHAARVSIFLQTRAQITPTTHR